MGLRCLRGRKDFEEVIHRQWGYLLTEDRCPVWVSEFGTQGAESYDLRWFRRFVKVLGALEAPWEPL